MLSLLSAPTFALDFGPGWVWWTALVEVRASADRSVGPTAQAPPASTEHFTPHLGHGKTPSKRVHVSSWGIGRRCGESWLGGCSPSSRRHHPFDGPLVHRERPSQRRTPPAGAKKEGFSVYEGVCDSVADRRHYLARHSPERTAGRTLACIRCLAEHCTGAGRRPCGTARASSSHGQEAAQQRSPVHHADRAPRAVWRQED